MARNRIFLVDDDPVIRFAIRSFLESQGMQVTEAESVQRAQEKFRGASPDAAIVDFSLPDGDGLELLEHFKGTDPDLPVIVLTGQGSIELAVRAIKQGAEQFLTKPVELPALHTLLMRALENKRYRRHSLVNLSRARRERLDPFLGTSVAIRKLQELSRRVVSSDSPILIQGETGSGKGVLAKWIHENSPRAEEVFMDLNCAGLEREFLETELFGHERGAFTGAVHSKLGLLEVADRGTVFLDEIGDIDLTVQPKLLKVLETQQFRRLGDVHDRTVDIRLISATHRDLKDLVRQQRFREDLFFRITIIPIRIPPLRERPEDIPLLAHDILGRIALGARAWRNRSERRGHDDADPVLVAGKHPGDAERSGAWRADRGAQSTHSEGSGTAVAGKPAGETRFTGTRHQLNHAGAGIALHWAGADGRARLDRTCGRTAGDFAKFSV